MHVVPAWAVRIAVIGLSLGVVQTNESTRKVLRLSRIDCGSIHATERLTVATNPFRLVDASETVDSYLEFDVVLPPRSAANGLHEDSMGLSLSPSLMVVGFVRTAEGAMLAAEQSGMINVGDELVAVNGMRARELSRVRKGAGGLQRHMGRLFEAAGVAFEEISEGPLEGPWVLQRQLRAAASGKLPIVLTLLARRDKPVPGLHVPGDYSVAVDASLPLGLLVDGALFIRHVLDGRAWPGGDSNAQWSRGASAALPARSGSGDATTGRETRRAELQFSRMGHRALGPLARLAAVMPGDRVVAVDGRALLADGVSLADARHSLAALLNASALPSVEVTCSGPTTAMAAGDDAPGSPSGTVCGETRVERPPRRVVLTLRPPLPWHSIMPSQTTPSATIATSEPTNQPGGDDTVGKPPDKHVLHNDDSGDLNPRFSHPELRALPPLPHLSGGRSPLQELLRDVPPAMRSHLPTAKLSCGLRGCLFGAPSGVLRLLTRPQAAAWHSERARTGPVGGPHGAADPRGLPRGTGRGGSAGLASLAQLASGGRSPADRGRALAVPENLPPVGLLALPFKAALFGGRFMCRARPVVVAVPMTACERLRNGRQAAGAVLVVRRGGCIFAQKAQMAADAAAAALVVLDFEGSSGRLSAMPAPPPGHGPRLGDLDAVSAAMISGRSGELLLREMEAGVGSALLAQFGTAVDPADDLCLPARQAALSTRPALAPGRSKDPMPLLGDRREPSQRDGSERQQGLVLAGEGRASESGLARVTLDGTTATLASSTGDSGSDDEEDPGAWWEEDDWEAGGIEAADAFVRAWKRRSRLAPLG